MSPTCPNPAANALAEATAPEGQPPADTTDAADLRQLKRLRESAGEIRKRLEWVPGDGTGGGRPHRLFHPVTHWLSSLSSIIAKAEASAAADLRTPLSHFLSNKGYGNDRDLDGFRYAILARDGQFEPACRRLEEGARQAFLDDPATYALFPKEWLPAAFRQRLEPMLADGAYLRGDNPTAAADWDAFERHLSRRRREPARAGLATGLGQVDDALGGLRGLSFLAGGPGVGKSCLSLALAVGVLERHPGVGVLVVLSDPGMTRSVVYERLLSAASGIPVRDLRSEERWNASDRQLAEARQSLRQTVLGRLRVAETGARPRQASELWQYLAGERVRLARAAGVRRVLTVIDHFHALRLAPPEPGGAPAVEENRSRLTVLQDLQSLTRTPGLPAGDPLLVLAEVRKGESGRARLSLDDVLGCAEIAYAADAVLLLEEDSRAPAAAGGTPLTLRVAKVRDGGRRGDVPLSFDYERAKVTERSPARRPYAGPPPGPSPDRRGGARVDPLAGRTED